MVDCYMETFNAYQESIYELSDSSCRDYFNVLLEVVHSFNSFNKDRMEAIYAIYVDIVKFFDGKSLNEHTQKLHDFLVTQGQNSWEVKIALASCTPYHRREHFLGSFLPVDQKLLLLIPATEVSYFEEFTKPLEELKASTSPEILEVACQLLEDRIKSYSLWKDWCELTLLTNPPPYKLYTLRAFEEKIKVAEKTLTL